MLFAQNLIGKDGATINRLRETYSCEISFDDKEEKVKVSGDDQIYNCVKEIMKIPIECEKREVCFFLKKDIETIASNSLSKVIYFFNFPFVGRAQSVSCSPAQPQRKRRKKKAL